ncbi:VOC family protein [Pragia fontium]|uniref:Catechol 2,3-dioxygenase n=1 Tax=Pragia fontium DSM 5563 = ATCC 49100 TaxID=1122977 RepID=A0AAJ5BG61_9GAMM|nr:VOC family protein [Pragia fontium]SFC19078.1 Catechol 2,3-dioxygenase [Pragia fontium DSM 5563 = ATCC 49100]VEJ53264.1 methylmalonyl-CoA epimerase [Pragia fontium]
MGLLKRHLHTAIITKDIDYLSLFYQILLNADVIKDITLDSYEFQTGIGLPGMTARTIHLYSSSLAFTLELTQFDDHHDTVDEKRVNTSGIRHLAFEVDDINSVIEALEQQKLKFTLVTKFPVRIKTVHNIIEFIYMRDLENNIIELISYKEL